MTIRLAIDAMGGDHGPPVTAAAACAFAVRHSDAQLTLVGRSAEVEAALAAVAVRPANVQVLHAEEVIAMDEPPAQALRGKRQSSMRVAINRVRDDGADAVVSAGNTGALMAIARFVLKTLDGIDRPAIASVIPNQTGGVTTMLDLGANVDCTPEHLLQFAVLGAALVAALEQRERPTVGLLNIGAEDIKGNDAVKQAGELLRASGLNFFGNVEGNDIYKGTTDVVVCDGFVGNVALKTSEGLAAMLATMIREEFTRGALSRVLALAAYPVLARLKRRVDHRRYNGASLLGLRGIVIKSHGSADAYAFEQAIERAYEAARHDLVGRTAAAMARLTAAARAGIAAAAPAGAVAAARIAAAEDPAPPVAP